MELLLEAARAAVPTVRDPHPCTVSCFRVGRPMEVGPDGKCRECSLGPTISRPRMLQQLVEDRPDLVASVCESFLLMRTLLDHPAVMAAAHSAHVRR